MGEIIGWLTIAACVVGVAYMAMDALSDSLMVTTILTGGRDPGESLGAVGCGVLVVGVIAAIVAAAVLW
jgi:hypothetical protein